MDVIISHYDADGYVSHYLLRSFLLKHGGRVRSCFAKFLTFGIEDGLRNVVCWDGVSGSDSVRDASRVWVLDLGSSVDSLRNLRSVFDGEVYWVDHHLHEGDFEEVVLEDENITTLISTAGCTTSIITQYILKKDPHYFKDPVKRKIALAGMAGDGQLQLDMSVREEYKITANAVEELRNYGLVVERGLYGDKLYPVHVMVGAYLNSIRRMLVPLSGRLEWVGLRFLEEFEFMGGDLFSPSSVWDRVEMMLLTPALYGVMELYRSFLDVRKRLFNGEGVDLLKVREGMVLAVIDWIYDVGGIYATHLLHEVGRQYGRFDDIIQYRYAELEEKGLIRKLRENGMSRKEIEDMIREICTGIAVVFNRALGTVSIRGVLPFTDLGEVARKLFGGGGHRVVGAGRFVGSSVDFVRYVEDNLVPVVEEGLRKVFDEGAVEEYVRWRSGG